MEKAVGFVNPSNENYGGLILAPYIALIAVHLSR